MSETDRLVTGLGWAPWQFIVRRSSPWPIDWCISSVITREQMFLFYTDVLQCKELMHVIWKSSCICPVSLLPTFICCLSSKWCRGWWELSIMHNGLFSEQFAAFLINLFSLLVSPALMQPSPPEDHIIARCAPHNRRSLTYVEGSLLP